MGVGLERQDEELLELPEALLLPFVLQLWRRVVEREHEIRGGLVDPAAVRIRIIRLETVGARAHDTAVDDALAEPALVHLRRQPREIRRRDLGQKRKVSALQSCLVAVHEAHAVGMLWIRRYRDDGRHRAGGKHVRRRGYGGAEDDAGSLLEQHGQFIATGSCSWPARLPSCRGVESLSENPAGPVASNRT